MVEDGALPVIDLTTILANLSTKRLVFHSEADFQHALAWTIHETIPDAKVRLEVRPLPRVRLDIWLRMPGGPIAIELKYLARRLSAEVDGESFQLNNQAAQDLRRYDFVKDISRLERVVEAVPNATGHAVLLTNDSTYWTRSIHHHSIDSAFRLHEERRFSGALHWAQHAAPGTIAGRADPLVLRGSYDVHWRNFSIVNDSKAGTFRYVVVDIG